MPFTPVIEPVPVPAGGTTRRLGAERCRTLLAQASSGHLALSQGALPIVVPVTCAIDDEQLFVRAGLLLEGRAPLPGVVAFQTGGTTLIDGCMWEVMVQGHAELLDESRISNRPPQLTLVDAGLTTVLRIGIELLRGWHYGTDPWPTGLSSADNRTIPTSQGQTSDAS